MEGPRSVRRHKDQDLDDASVSLRTLSKLSTSRFRADTMCSTDMALIKDKSFKTWALKYAKSEEEFFKE